MTKEERTILAHVNTALAERGRKERIKPHRLFPMDRTFVHYRGDKIVVLRPRERTLSVFTRDEPGSLWGSTRVIGHYRGRGWLATLTLAAVDTIEHVARLSGLQRLQDSHGSTG